MPTWMRDHHLAEDVEADLSRADPLWPGQIATLVALAIYFALPTQLTIGPQWPIPATELLVLLALFVGTRRGVGRTRRRLAAIALVCVAITSNLIALALLSHYLVAGGNTSGSQMIGGGALIWTTNWLLFAVLYWELDRGGPLQPPGDHPPVAPDLLFPPMSDPDFAPPGWMPHFLDYLYVSLTNQTAFSPTDTMPMTPRTKIAMGLQGAAGLVTVGLILARAVNLLG
jgi:hypothetical protein